MLDRISFLTLTVCLLVVTAGPMGLAAESGEEEEISAPQAMIHLRAVTEQDVSEDETLSERATGLDVVGVGSAVYLDGMGIAPEGATIAEYRWKITGPGDYYSETDSQNIIFRPPNANKYLVTLTVVDSNGDESEAATLDIVAARYVGISNCQTCHSGVLPTLSDKVTPWKETGHGTMLERNLDTGSAHYSENCIHCHTVGYDENADNNGFDDVARQVGWTFPETIEPGNWEALETNFPDLANLANIQCESCHGPGSLHNGTPGTMATTLDSAMCGYCHDALSHHTKNYEWDTSRHAVATSYPSGPGREGCVECHTGVGFVQAHDSDYEGEVSTDYSPIGCAVCHDPHHNDNAHQVRVVEDVMLANGMTVSAEEAGLGALCMNCHKSRRDVNEYVQEYHSHYGPHYAPQADMLKGTGGYEYPGIEYTRFAAHLSITEDSCVSCHMAEAESEHLRAVGSHSFRISAAANEIEGVTTAVFNANACARCHGEMEDSNYLAKGDYDGDGIQEGIKDEVHGLLTLVGKLLPPYDLPDVEVTEAYTADELKAAYNYLFVEEDKSAGVHNAKYAVQLLQSSYHAMTGQSVPNADLLVKWTVDIPDWSKF